MNWYVNDLSLYGQFRDPFSFRRTLEPLMRLMNDRSDLRSRIFCSRGLSLRPVTGSHSLAQAVRAMQDQLFLSLVLRWVDKAGPFWEPGRAANDYDLFHFEEENVTEQGLGEAARRLAAGLPAGAFSFAQSPEDRFATDVLSVMHGFPEEPFGTYDVTNCWDVGAFPTATGGQLRSWEEMLTRAGDTMPGLVLSEEIANQLAPRPFDPGAAEHMLSLLGVLQTFTEETTEGGEWTPAGMELYQRYCMRQGARISDSSDPEKLAFRNQMTFPDPSHPGRRLFCPWHAKLNYGAQYRIHFEWKRPAGQREIKVVYIGSKITRQ